MNELRQLTYSIFNYQYYKKKIILQTKLLSKEIALLLEQRVNIKVADYKQLILFTGFSPEPVAVCCTGVINCSFPQGKDSFAAICPFYSQPEKRFP